MKVEWKTGEGLKRELSVEIPAEQVKQKTEEKYHEVRSSVTLKGFRKGKAPLEMIRTLYANEVQADVIDDLIKTTFPDAVKETELQVASRPTLNDVKFTDDGGVLYTATVEVFPEIGAIISDGLHIKNEPLEVTDQEVNESIDYIRKRNAELRPVEREVQENDVVLVDLKKLADPKLVLKESEFPSSQIDLSSHLTLPAFKQGLLGLKAGDSKEIEVQYPEDYNDAEFAGAYLKYLCTIKAVKERLMPELDDFFAKQTQLGETALEMKLKIRKDLEGLKKDTQERNQKRLLVEQMLEKNPIPIPDGMVEDYLDAVVEDFRKTYGDRVDETAVRKEHRQSGIAAMRWDLVWHKLAEQEKIEVAPSDTEEWVQQFADKNKITREDALEALNKSGRVNSLRDSLLEQKVLNFLLGKAKIE